MIPCTVLQILYFQKIVATVVGLENNSQLKCTNREIE